LDNRNRRPVPAKKTLHEDALRTTAHRKLRHGLGSLVSRRARAAQGRSEGEKEEKFSRRGRRRRRRGRTGLENQKSGAEIPEESFKRVVS